MLHYDWIVFDSTGTLMTPDPEPADVYQAIARRLGNRQTVDQVRLQLRAAMVRHFFGETENDPTSEDAERERWMRIVADTLPGLRGRKLVSAFDLLWHHFAASDTWRLYQDVLPTLDRLRSRGYSIAIASNFDGRLRNVLAGKGIADQFDAVLISSEVGWSKPDRRFYDTATGRLGCQDRSRLLMIGDTQRGDVDAARQAGWEARLLVRDGDDALLQVTSDL